MKYAVIGLGKMGVDWVANLVEGGYEVVGFDVAAEARERAPRALTKGLGWIAKKRHPDEDGFAEAKQFPFAPVDADDAIENYVEACRIVGEVAGDFYDYVRLPNGSLAVLLGDVAGKGVPAALFMALSRSIIRTKSMSGRLPAGVLRRANTLIYKDTQEASWFSLCEGLFKGYHGPSCVAPSLKSQRLEVQGFDFF